MAASRPAEETPRIIYAFAAITDLSEAYFGLYPTQELRDDAVHDRFANSSLADEVELPKTARGIKGIVTLTTISGDNYGAELELFDINLEEIGGFLLTFPAAESIAQVESTPAKRPTEETA